MPTTPYLSFTYNRLDPLFNEEDARPMPVMLKGPNTYLPGTILGEITATPGVYAPWNANAVDGTQNPKVWTRLQTAVDANNLVTWPGDFQNVGRPFIDVYRSGTFKLDQILGLNAVALEALAGRVVEGVLGTNESDTVTLSAATNTWDLTITGADGVAHTFLGLAGNITAANLQALIDPVLGAGYVKVTLSGLVYTFMFGGAGGTQAITVASLGHTITATAAQVTAGAAATVPAGQHGVVQFGV